MTRRESLFVIRRVCDFFGFLAEIAENCRAKSDIIFFAESKTHKLGAKAAEVEGSTRSDFSRPRQAVCEESLRVDPSTSLADSLRSGWQIGADFVIQFPTQNTTKTWFFPVRARSRRQRLCAAGCGENPDRLGGAGRRLGPRNPSGARAARRQRSRITTLIIASTWR
jgi:hypothetical protein